MHEHIIPISSLDKSIAFGGIKPFHYTLFSHYCISPLPFPAALRRPGRVLKLSVLSHGN
jgi:hypothetical protein